MKISAIICTHNRAGLLDKAIISLTNQKLSVLDYEIIVVDNASNDGTQKVVHTLMRKVPNLQYVYEPNLGLSHARNIGMRIATGEIVAYMDDDAIATPDWLEMIVNAFENTEPMPACVGGKVEPIWEIPKPDWVPEELVGYLSLVDLGDTGHGYDITKEFLIGCNIAFLKRFLSAIGGFSPLLGRKGTCLTGNEEIALLIKMKNECKRIFYEPRAIVYHFIPKERLTKKWFVRRLYHEAISQQVLNREYNGEESGQLGARSIARALRSAGANALKGILATNAQQSILYYTRAAFYLGKASYMIKGKMQFQI